MALPDDRDQPADLGIHLGALKLKGQIAASDGTRHPARLCLTTTGVWLCDDAEPRPRAAIDLRELGEWRYEPGRLGDSIVVGGQTFGVPTGKGSAARRMIGLGRLRGGEPSEARPMGRFVEARSELHEAWLRGWLEADETLLGWLQTSSTVEVPSAVGPAEEVTRWFALTTHRAALVAVTSLGDVSVALLPDTPIEREDLVGRDRLHAGALSWRTTLTNESAHAELASLAQLPTKERTFEVAGRLWRAGKGPTSDRDRARELLERLASEHWPWALVTLRTIDFDAGAMADLDTPLRSLADEGAPGASAWLGWASTWGIAADRLVTVAARMRAIGHAGEESLAIEQCARLAKPEEPPDPLVALEVDGLYAEHLAELGRSLDARRVLEASLARLPSAELYDLLPPADQRARRDAKSLRLQALDRMARLPTAESTYDTPTRLALAQLDPLDTERVTALCEADDATLAARAGLVVEILAPGGLDASADRTQRPDDAPETSALEPQTAASLDGEGPVRTLSEEQLFERVQHPIARKGGALGKLQAFLASVEAPDHSALKSYCERLGPARSSVAQQALTDAVLALGVAGLEAYVSRGDKSVGFRAYDGKPPFLLIGGEHLEPGAPCALDRAELRFAIGSEVAHIRFGHARVTSGDVWSGAFDKGREAASLLLGLLPALKLLRIGGRLATAAEAVPTEAVGAVVGAAARLAGGDGRSEPAGRSVDRATEDLVAAHRVTQFTADRAGLVLAGDLRAALRALFLCRPEYAPELEVAHREGLAKAVTRRSSKGTLVHGDLALRVCALIAFFLSDDYGVLRSALRE